VRRLAQAQHVATIVQEKTKADAPVSVVILGDLNDFYPSKPIATLQGATIPALLHLYDYLPPLDRYSYIFNGASQVLDHILVTADLTPMIAAVDLIHINADYPSSDQADPQIARRSSDHDPVQVRVRPSGAAILAGNLQYPHIQVQLRNTNPATATIGAANGTIVDETTTDDNGDFRIWNLEPGAYTLTFTLPPALSMDNEQISLHLSAGYNRIADISVTHRTVKLGTALALTTWTPKERATRE
jgi:hypothetical protein